jgi:hypothetical protein
MGLDVQATRAVGHAPDVQALASQVAASTHSSRGKSEGDHGASVFSKTASTD